MKFKIHQMLKAGEAFRVVAFGSSNTQRFQVGMHWFDFVELGFKSVNGGCGQFINSGIGGNTTLDLLRRFDNELALYKPHLVIMTIGGNDANPNRELDADTYRNNLKLLHEKITGLGAELVFQTYYGCDLEQLDPDYTKNLVKYMQTIREVAQESGCHVVDHFARWEKLRVHDVEVYRSMMRDAMHVNPLGNMVMGLDLIDFFEMKLPEEFKLYCREGLTIKSYLDTL
jgi:lysophospholipase L1-like esterase